MSGVINRAELVRRGANALDKANTKAAAGDLEEAVGYAEIASAYARLADALGDARFTERTVGHNW